MSRASCEIVILAPLWSSVVCRVVGSCVPLVGVVDVEGRLPAGLVMPPGVLHGLAAVAMVGDHRVDEALEVLVAPADRRAHAVEAAPGPQLLELVMWVEDEGRQRRPAGHPRGGRVEPDDE